MPTQTGADPNLATGIGSSRTPGRLPAYFFPLLIALTTCVVYAGSLHGAFVFDDIPELLHNPDIQTPGGCLNTVSRSADTGLAGRPLACLTFAANYALHGWDVRGYHVVNIVIHLGAALALYGLIRRTLIYSTSFRRSKEHASEVAAVIALLWAVHPLQTESVTYVIQRIESLAGLWYLLTLYCAVRSLDSKTAWGWQTLSVICCICGMLTKENVATAPVAVMLCDHVFAARADARPRRRAFFYVALCLTWIVSILLILAGPRGGTVGFGLGVSALDYLRSQAGVILYYLRLVFWPFPQAISYADWPIVRTWAPALIPGAAVLFLLGAAVVGVVKQRWWGFCGACFFLLLAPSSSFVPIVTEPAAERRMYLPLACVLGACVGFFGSWQGWILAGRTISGRTLTQLAVVVLSMATMARNLQYESPVEILRATLQVRPGDELVRGALIEELVESGQLEQAEAVFSEGLTLSPRSHVLCDNWARSLRSVGRRQEAVEWFSRAVAQKPDYSPAHAALGATLIETGDFSRAVEVLREAVRLSPRSYTARGNLAIALANLGGVEEAIDELRAAIDLKPNYAEGHYNLGRLMLGRSRREEALKHLQKAVELRPSDHGFAQALEEARRSAVPSATD